MLTLEEMQASLLDLTMRLVALEADLSDEDDAWREAQVGPVQDSIWQRLHSFDIRIASATSATILAGYVNHGNRTPIAVSATTVTLSAGVNYIYLEYAYGSGPASIQVSASRPQSDSTAYRRVLFSVDPTADGVLKLKDERFNVELPGEYG